MARIGFIGLGNMGLPMAANLGRAGHEVYGFDLAEASRGRLVRAGGKAVESLADAVRGAELVITMLPAGPHVRDVLTRPDGVLANAGPGALLVDSSTIDVRTSRELAAEAGRRGVAMLDAPVSGGTAGATAGTLTFMVGGERAAFEHARPYLEQMGRTIVHAGPAGAGQAAKVCNNLMLGISMVGVAEAFALADKLRLDRQALFDISSKSSGQCWALTGYCPVPGPVSAAPSNRDYEAGFAVDLMLKDLTLATAAEAETGAASVLGQAARGAYERLSRLGLGSKDFSVIARALLEGRFSG
jgi:3-hydroxyisobutyrate dehydrogenase